MADVSAPPSMGWVPQNQWAIRQVLCLFGLKDKDGQMQSKDSLIDKQINELNPKLKC